jgi:hypothetical protein
LISREAYAKEEFENAKQAMQDWEVLAMNERSLRENLAEKDAELREQLESMRDQYEKAARDRDTNNQAVEGLQKALQEVQNRKCRPCFDWLRPSNNLQYGKPSSKSRSKHTNHKSTNSASKSKPQNLRQMLPKRRLSQRKRILSERCRLRRRSRRRTC